MSEHSENPYRQKCPYCGTGEGFVRAVGFGGGLKTLTFKCAECQRSWEAKDASPSPWPTAVETSDSVPGR